MTTVSTNTVLETKRPSLFARIGLFLVAYAEAKSRSAQIRELTALSDEELARRGLTRESIVNHVFADSLYL